MAHSRSPRQRRDELLGDYLGITEGVVLPLEPDLIAEHWILRTLQERGTQASKARDWQIFQRAVEKDVDTCGEFLLRACQDFPDLTECLPASAVDCAAAKLPHETVALRPTALELVRRQLENARRANEKWAEYADSGSARQSPDCL